MTAASARQGAIRGRLVRFLADPFIVPPGDAIAFDEDGIVVFRDGLIDALGPADEMLARTPDLEIDHVPDGIILPGFIDCHVHYPQLRIIASYGARLFDWLNTYTFPEELRFADAAYARATAELFLDELARNGTTSACVYSTVHACSADALFAAAEARGVRIATGKMMMDRGAPEGLLDTVQTGYDDSARLAGKWHGRGRATYVISPRFAPTSSPEQLEAAGTLWNGNPDALLQTHLSEQVEEVAHVGRLYPDARDYLDVYERAGLLRPGANFGHAIQLTDRERAAICESGAGISHCPTSNQFIGSGLFDLAGMKSMSPAVPVGLGSDVGGGSSFSMLDTMRAAYEVAQLRQASLHPVQALHLATSGAARVMRLDHKVGNIAVGLEADITVMDPAATPLLATRTPRAESISDVLFALMILGDDRAILRTYSAGRLIHTRG